MKPPSFMLRRGAASPPPGVRAEDLPPALRDPPRAAPELPKTAVSLPSRGVFYGGRDQVMLTPLTVAQVKGIFSASRIKSDYDQAKTMAGVVQGSVHDFDVLDLTTDDYRFVMYWLKLNSYPTVPFTVRWHYFDGERDKEVTTAVSMSNWDITTCDDARVPRKGLDWPRVRDLVDMHKMEDPAARYVAEYAQVLQGENLAAKVAKLETEPASILHDIKHHLLDFEHGVSEYVNVSDPEGKEPQKTFQVGVTLALADFFP